MGTRWIVAVSVMGLLLSAAGCARRGAPEAAGAPEPAADPAARELLARVAVETREQRLLSPASLAALEALRAKYPQAPEILALLRPEYARRQDWEGLIRLESAQPQGAPGQRLVLAKLYLKVGRHGDASAILEPLARAAPADAELAALAGLALFREGQYERAAPLLDAARQGLPESQAVEPATELGLIHFYQGRLDQAVELLAAAARSAPDYGPAHNALGRALSARGDERQARLHFARARELQARASADERRRLRLNSLSHDLDQARRERRAGDGARLVQEMLPLADGPQQAALLRVLAELLAADGKPDEARAALERAQARGPTR